jgi:fermentation-respiration switch protein FrsA (DUF1100 family)
MPSARSLLQRTFRLVRGLAAFVLLGAVLLGAILGWLKWHEDELVFATTLSHERTNGQIPSGAEKVAIRETTGTSLAAVIFQADSSYNSGYWVLHFHGNAESAFSRTQLSHCQSLASLGLNVLGFDYRGFGLSPGVASEIHMDEDAEAAYEYLRQRGVPADRIILWGHSLGSGPATFLAGERPAAALVLFGAFTSVPDAAADTYPYLPVRWLVSVHFNSLTIMPRLHLPVLIVHTTDDTLIPIQEGKRLYAAAQEPKQLLILKGPFADGFGGHVDGLYDHLDLLRPKLSMLIGAALQQKSPAAAPQ